MRVLEIARRLAQLNETERACQAYALALNECEGQDPGVELEAALYILRFGGGDSYQISYTVFCRLYNAGFCQEDILQIMNEAFYVPNIKLFQTRYRKNCALLAKYPYIFQKNFLPFEDLPIRFFPFDDTSYVPFYPAEKRFGDYIDLKRTVIQHNFFKDLENPIQATDIYSQYELEYLRDNVRRSEDVARENHVYLHYTSWEEFCAYLTCLNLRPLLEEKKLVFLIGDEIQQYPIDFKERFGIDYSQYTLQPVRLREINRLIWHTQLSTHNGGDFFNEVFDHHPNLLTLPSMMMSNLKENVNRILDIMGQVQSLKQAQEVFEDWKDPRTVEELYHMKNRTAKDCMVALYMQHEVATLGLDPASRIVPAVFFQPHFSNIVYTLEVDEKGNTVLNAPNYEEIKRAPEFHGFKYIKTFTPMRRFTTSHGATVRFMYLSAVNDTKISEADGTKSVSVVSDAISERIFNRSFMIDPDDRLYRDGILVRFEDGKTNPKATFTALAAFLDLPYTESMTYCSEGNVRDPHGETKGFDPAPVYKTYDDYVNNSERYFIEYFLRDAYEYYGYSFQQYDGEPVDEAKAEQLISEFTTMNHYIRETWRYIYEAAEVTINGERVDEEKEKKYQNQMLEDQIQKFNTNRFENAKILLRGLHFVNKRGQPLYMMPMLEPDPALLERPLYH